MSPHGPWFAALAVTLACAPLAAAASFPPEYQFRSLSTPRVTIHFHQGLEATAREAAALADEIIVRHEARYGYRLGRVQMVLADDEDDPNGFSTPLPYPMVHLRAAAPDASADFGNLDSWMRLLLTHELAHNIHIDQARGLFGLGRSVFGRAPFLFPNAVAPQWQIEGLATYEETQGTSFGRGRNPDSIMVRRMAALAGEYPSEDKATTGYDRWPLGQTHYLFGEAFVRELTRRFGEETLPRIARVHSSWPLPFFDELTGHRVTGKGFHWRWREFVRRETERFESEAAAIRAKGLTTSRALTARGVRQIGARVSPDGTTLAFTSSSLARRRAIHLMEREPGRERKLVERNGGLGLSWTPDGRSLVFDDAEVHRLFTNRYDLRLVDVYTGRTRWITRGARARDPEVSPDGGRVVFVKRYPDRSELAVVDLDGRNLRDITRSDPAVQWSGPAWHPRDGSIVASRWLPGGWSDLVRVDPETGGLTELTHDRARDLEPTWTPDATLLVFRSDRDGISNIYARREDGTLLRLTRVLGGAFAPAFTPEGRLLFSSYGAGGYDLHEAEIDWAGLAEAEPFVDTYPPPQEAVAPAPGEVTPYRPFSTLLPRFWAPYIVTDGELRLGAVSGGSDPLYRHAWGAEGYRRMESGRFGGTLFYRYDRFLPELTVLASQDLDRDEGVSLEKRALTVRALVPVHRTRRVSHQVSLAWRRSRNEASGGDGLALPFRLDRSGLELAWTLSRDLQTYPYSISPSHGERFRVALAREVPVLGSGLSWTKAVVDARLYRRLRGDADVLALRLGGGTTWGESAFTRSFSVGGFPDGALLESLRTNHSVLRGYRDDAYAGRHFLHANAEYRVPLSHPQRGVWSLPFFVRHLHGSVFLDAAHAWTGTLHPREIKTAVGAALGADLYLAHGVPFTATAGVAEPLSIGGAPRAYVRFGLSY